MRLNDISNELGHLWHELLYEIKLIPKFPKVATYAWKKDSYPKPGEQVDTSTWVNEEIRFRHHDLYATLQKRGMLPKPKETVHPGQLMMSSVRRIVDSEHPTADDLEHYHIATKLYSRFIMRSNRYAYINV